MEIFESEGGKDREKDRSRGLHAWSESKCPDCEAPAPGAGYEILGSPQYGIAMGFLGASVDFKCESCRSTWKARYRWERYCNLEVRAQDGRGSWEPMSQEEYGATAGKRCPLCRADDVSSDFSFTPSEALVHRTCSDCGSRWDDSCKGEDYCDLYDRSMRKRDTSEAAAQVRKLRPKKVFAEDFPFQNLPCPITVATPAAVETALKKLKKKLDQIRRSPCSAPISLVKAVLPFRIWSWGVYYGVFWGLLSIMVVGCVWWAIAEADGNIITSIFGAVVAAFMGVFVWLFILLIIGLITGPIIDPLVKAWVQIPWRNRDPELKQIMQITLDCALHKEILDSFVSDESLRFEEWSSGHVRAVSDYSDALINYLQKKTFMGGTSHQLIRGKVFDRYFPARRSGASLGQPWQHNIYEKIFETSKPTVFNSHYEQLCGWIRGDLGIESEFYDEVWRHRSIIRAHLDPHRNKAHESGEPFWKGCPRPTRGWDISGEELKITALIP